jgi:glycosyl transferase family 25
MFLILISLAIFLAALGLWIKQWFVLPSPSAEAPPLQGLPPFEGVGVLVINLDRSPERLAHMQPFLDGLKLPFQRVSAVDGGSLSRESIEALVSLKAFKALRGRLPSRGEVGCSLSHHKALESFLKTNWEAALILEDDTHFDPLIVTRLIDAAMAKSEAWDVLALQLNHRGLPKRIAPLGKEGHSLVHYRGHIVESGAYLIRRPAAQAYLERFFPIRLPYDYFFTREWEFGIRFRGVEPRPVRQVLAHSYIASSDVLMSAEPCLRKSWVRFFQKASKYFFNFNSNLMRFFKASYL